MIPVRDWLHNHSLDDLGVFIGHTKVYQFSLKAIAVGKHDVVGFDIGM